MLFSCTICCGGSGNEKTGAGSTDIPGHIKAGKKTSEHDDLLIPKQYLSSESRTELVHARTSRKMTQVELNNALSFPTNTINGIESGKYCPTAKQLDVMNRYLGTKLHYG
jgi:ribosome-binding protein aMBF1 (putative translation factor)